MPEAHVSFFRNERRYLGRLVLQKNSRPDGAICGSRSRTRCAWIGRLWAEWRKRRSPVMSQFEISTRSRFRKAEGFPMADARCSCGALTLTLHRPSKLVVACHCLDCQRRTGAPFGVGAFYPADAVAISGTAERVHPRFSKRREGPHLFLSELRVNDLLEGRQPTVVYRRCSGRASRPKIPCPCQIDF